MKENDTVFYNTPEGKVEVAITKIFGNKVKIIWNEKEENCIKGKEAIVLLNKLEEK